MVYLCQDRGLGGTSERRQLSNVSGHTGMGQGRECIENHEAIHYQQRVEGQGQIGGLKGGWAGPLKIFQNMVYILFQTRSPYSLFGNMRGGSPECHGAYVEVRRQLLSGVSSLFPPYSFLRL